MAVLVIGWWSNSSLHSQTTYEPYYFRLFAGSVGSLGSSDGAATVARFNAPQGVAVDGNGNVYIADSGNNTIRKITPGGLVSTLAGFAGSAGSADGAGSAARFNLPQGIAVDTASNVYVADSVNDTIRKITPAGDVTTLAGAANQAGSTDGPGNTARFFYPIGVSVDSSGNVYVADNGNSTIRAITPAGVVSTLAGLAGNGGSDNGTGSAARFSFPTRLAYDQTTGIIYVADTGNNIIRKVTLAGVVTTLAGSPGVPGTSDGIGSAALFDGPRGISVDGAGNVYVASTNSHTIRKIRSGAVVTTLAGSPGSAGSADGLGSHARFDFPYALAADFAGHLYVTDTTNHTVRFGLPGGEGLSLRITLESNNKKLLTGQAFPNVMVDLTATSDLSNSFQPLVTITADPSGGFQYEDTASVRRYYRASTSGN